MNWRDYGDVPLETFISEFERLGSPMLGDAKAIWEATKPHSALALAMMFVEGKYETLHDIPLDYHNPLSLAKPGGTPADGDDRWVKYSSFPQGAKAWKDRITSPTYKDGIYAKTETLEDLIGVYAPPSENVTTRYVAQVKELLEQWPRLPKEPPVAGVALQTVSIAGFGDVQIPADIIFKQEIIPSSQTNQRPGHGFYGGSATYYTQHETANPGVGMGAAAHSRYMHNGAPDRYGNPQQLGYHFTCDDRAIYQMIPVSEMTWHAGDSGGNGNYDSIACELCVNADANKARARRNAEWLAAAICEAMNIQQHNVKQHNWWSGKDCPHVIRSENYWTTYLSNVAANRVYLSGAPDAPDYAKPVILDLGTWDGKDRTLDDGTVLRAARRVVKARRTTKRYQLAAEDSPSIGPDIKKGEEATIDYVFQAKKGGSRWGYTPYGTRLKMSHFDPYVTVTPSSKE